MTEAAMRGADLLIGSNLGFSISPKDPDLPPEPQLPLKLHIKVSRLWKYDVQTPGSMFGPLGLLVFSDAGAESVHNMDMLRKRLNNLLLFNRWHLKNKNISSANLLYSKHLNTATAWN